MNEAGSSRHCSECITMEWLKERSILPVAMNPMEIIAQPVPNPRMQWNPILNLHLSIGLSRRPDCPLPTMQDPRNTRKLKFLRLKPAYQASHYSYWGTANSLYR